MKSKKKVASAMLAAILVGLMSFSVYAATGDAYASASDASASVRSTIKGHIEGLRDYMQMLWTVFADDVMII